MVIGSFYGDERRSAAILPLSDSQNTSFSHFKAFHGSSAKPPTSYGGFGGVTGVFFFHPASPGACKEIFAREQIPSANLLFDCTNWIKF